MAGKKDTTSPLDYRSAGVDIDAGNAFVAAIKGHAGRTARDGADTALGGFGGGFDLKAAGYKDPVLVAATDGVGTKLELARDAGYHRGLGIDLVAMCANDVLAQGALPLFFLDYFATSKLEPDVAKEIVAGIADGCIEAGCALIGGETAEMPGVYPGGGYDLAGFCVGAVERGQHIDPARTKAGDIAIAIASSGVHANGFSLVWKVIERTGIGFNAPTPFESEAKVFGAALMTPTLIYVGAYKAALESLGGDVTRIHGLAHITGGGLMENPQRGFADGLKLEFDPINETPPLFGWLMKAGNIHPTEMRRVFNCGIGMLVYTTAGDADTAIAAINKAGYTAWAAGELVKRDTDESQVSIRT